MPIDPVKIPQNVYIEDRIVGPLTLRQTLIMAAGGGFSYALYASLSKAAGPLNLFTTILVWVPCALSVIFALVKINDLSLLRICLLLLERINKPSVRTWAPRRGLSITIHTRPTTEKETPAAPAAPQKTQKRIQELSSVVDQGFLQGEAEADWDDERTTPPPPPAEDLPPFEETSTDDNSDHPVFPVDPSRISVDHPEDDDDAAPPLSDLSIFRDIFPPDKK